MINYKYGQKDYAEKIFKDGFQTKYINTELALLALYFRDVLLYKPKKRTEELYKFCEKHIPNYNKAKHFRTIDRALRYADNKKNIFIIIPEIKVYKKEIDYINSLDLDYNYKKVLFTFLVQKKIENRVYLLRNGCESDSIYFKGGKSKYSNIKNCSKIPANLKINEDIIYNLNEVGLISIKNQGLIELLFMNKCVSKGEIGLIITCNNDFDNTGWYFDFCNQQNNVILCNYCKQPFKQNSNNQKYCKNCCNQIANEQTKIRMRKLRNKNVTQ